MKPLQHIIVPGVGGSNEQHWQSILQNQLQHCIRIEQDWHRPILSQWVENWIKTVEKIHSPIQIIAHSFGCLTTIAALEKRPDLSTKIKKLVLVAPANPSRFSEFGFSNPHTSNYLDYFSSIKIDVPAVMLFSENDPWLSKNDAEQLAQKWNIQTKNLGCVGHINVASGFGHFPALKPYLHQKTQYKTQHPTLFQPCNYLSQPRSVVLSASI